MTVITMHCADCGIDLMPNTPVGSPDWERYMVRDTVWRASGMRPNGGWLCIGCLTERLGRPLTGADFPVIPINEPGRDDDTPRLAALKLAAASHAALKARGGRGHRRGRGPLRAPESHEQTSAHTPVTPQDAE